MQIDIAQVAIVIGVANGVLLLLKPVARLHYRIDQNAHRLDAVEKDMARLLASIRKS